MILETKCPECGERHEMEVDEQKFFQWKKGLFIQEAFPEMSAENRERLLTGICPKCWNDIFPDE